MKRAGAVNGMDHLPVKRGSTQPPVKSGADGVNVFGEGGKSAAYAHEFLGAEEYLGVNEAFGITEKDSLYVGKMACGDWGPRYRSMPPGPNNWEVSFQWQKVPPGREGKYARDITAVIFDMATQFCLKNEDDSHDVSGLYSSNVTLVSETPPPQFGTTTFYWQEPCHARHRGNEIVENLHESVRRQCLCLMGGAPED